MLASVGCWSVQINLFHLPLMTLSLTALGYQVTRFQHSRLAYIASFLILTLQRSPVVAQLARFQQLLGQPIVHLSKVATPLAVFFGGTHALAGATGVVPAGGSTNPAEATVGESFTWVFRVTGETASSYTVRGLPQGLEKSSRVLSGGVSSFTGVPEEAGTFNVEIIGWRKSGESGDKTPIYKMSLNVVAGEPPTIATQPVGGTFDLGSDTSLHVDAVGGGLHYRWLKNGEQIPSTRKLIDEDTQRRVLVPNKAIDESWRSAIEFNDDEWIVGSGGVGFERSSDNTSDPYFKIDLESALYDKSNSALIRIPFVLNESDLRRANELMLRIQYDDGYAAFLNGSRVAAANAPTNLAWDSRASGGHDDALAVEHEELDLGEHLELLRVGTNLLAVQVMNNGSNSSDLLCNLELLGGRNTDMATLDLSGLTSADAGDYSVEISNGAGSLISDVASVQIHGEVTGFAGWQAEHWGESSMPEQALPGSDADGDGFSNLVEYYFGTNPRVAETGRRVTAEVERIDAIEMIALRFPRTDAVDITPSFEASSLLSTDSWQVLEHGVDGVEIVHGENESTVRIPMISGDRFVRMKITLQD